MKTTLNYCGCLPLVSWAHPGHTIVITHLMSSSGLLIYLYREPIQSNICKPYSCWGQRLYQFLTTHTLGAQVIHSCLHEFNNNHQSFTFLKNKYWLCFVLICFVPGNCLYVRGLVVSKKKFLFKKKRIPVKANSKAQNPEVEISFAWNKTKQKGREYGSREMN